MKRTTYILLIIGLAMILLGILSWEYIDTKCREVDHNTIFWVTNCNY